MTAETKVGLFTFLGAALLGLSIYLLGNFTVSSGYDIDVYFKNVSGLPAKSSVRLNGVEVGKVKKLKINGDKVLAVVRIDKDVIIYKNSRFTIAATSLIGTNYLQIDQGTPESGILQEGDVINGISLPSVSDMISQTMTTVNNLTSSINANGQFGRDLAETLDNLRRLSGNLNDLVVSLKPYISSSMSDVSELTKASKNLIAKVDNENGLLSALMDDPAMKDDAKMTLSNIKQVSEDAKKFIGNMAKFRMFWEYDARYQGKGGITESDLGIKFLPANGFSYYRVGISDMGNRDNLPKNKDDFRNKPNQIDARLGLYNDWADLSLGLIRGAGGGVLSVKPFFKADNYIVKNFAVYGEATDFGRNRMINNRLFDKADVSVGAKVNLTKNVGVGVRYDDMLETKTFQMTGSISFEDKELAAMLGLARMAN